MRVTDKLVESSVVGIDNWYESTLNLIEDELKLSPPSEDVSNETKLLYELTNSDIFARVYSRINKSIEFEYVDNESFYEDTQITLVYKIPGGKAKLYGDLNTEKYKLEVERV